MNTDQYKNFQNSARNNANKQFIWVYEFICLGVGSIVATLWTW
jgi:hypothetical protein